MVCAPRAAVACEFLRAKRKPPKAKILCWAVKEVAGLVIGVLRRWSRQFYTWPAEQSAAE